MGVVRLSERVPGCEDKRRFQVVMYSHSLLYASGHAKASDSQGMLVIREPESCGFDVNMHNSCFLKACTPRCISYSDLERTDCA